MTRTIARLCGAVLVVGFAGCDCGGGTKNKTGEVSYVVESVAGAQQVVSEGLYVFTPTAMGTTEPPSLNIQLRNTGAGNITVTSLEKTSGDAVKLGEVAEANPVFTVEYTPRTDVAAADTLLMKVTFTPPVTPNERVHEHEVKLLVRAENAGETESSVVTIQGRAISGECDLPTVIDFGGVNINNKGAQAVTFQNAGIIDAEAQAQNVEGEVAAFGYKGDSPSGDFIVEPNRERVVTLEFSPVEARDYLGTVKMRRAKGCPVVNVRLKGTGVNQCLTWKCDPSDNAGARCDFGYVQPGTSSEATVTFSNVCSSPVQISSLGIADQTFKIIAANTGDLTSSTVPAGTRDTMTQMLVPGTSTVKARFSPTGLGAKVSKILGSTNLGNQSSISIDVKGAGGGPDIDVRPAAGLNFGLVGYFAGQTPASYSLRKITVANVGTKPNPPDVRGNLRFQARGAAPFKYWTVTAMNSATQADELCLGKWDPTTGCANDLPTTGAGSYNPAVGLEASAGNALIDIPVRLTPTSVGMKVFQVTIYSNDPDEADFTYTIRADVQLLPPCNYEITPTSLNFGVVTPPSNRDLSFKIRNRGTQPTDICYVSALDLGTGSDPMFLLPAGPQAQLQINPGAEEIVAVRAWPMGALPATITPKTGQVTFSVTSPTNPIGIVNLSATLSPSCLTISPNDLNFGTVQRDCNSPDKVFQVYNTCPSAVNITGYRMAAPSRVPAGTGLCTDTAGCDEFKTVTVPTGFIGMLNPGATKTFTLKYHPYNNGPDTGAFSISVNQGASVDYLVTLRGAGDDMGLNEDVFRQDSKPKADILFVVDNSGSMSDKQMQLGTNFAAFLRYAVANQVDFQMGITTTDDDQSGGNCATGSECGKLVASTSGVKIFKNTTPNLEAQFTQTINVGTNGSATETCLSPATKALTAPLITDPASNAGFVRPEAVLAVVCVTDEAEQGSQPVPYYVNQMLNVKGAQRASQFSYNGIGPFNLADSACWGSGSGSMFDYDGPGVGRNSIAIAATNGVKESICTPNWAAALENLGRVAFGFRTNFYLTGRPADPGQIKVFIDNVERDRTDVDMRVIWDYDTVTNSVVFDPLYVPEPGQSMTIRYQVSCIP